MGLLISSFLLRSVDESSHAGNEIKTASHPQTEIIPKPHLNPVLRTILEGVYDENSNLSLLRGCPHILQNIWERVVFYWKTLIFFPKMEKPPIPRLLLYTTIPFPRTFPYDTCYAKLLKIKFPKPGNLNIRMMPFKMNWNFKESFLPNEIRPYFENLIRPLWRSFFNGLHHDDEKIVYLSILEDSREASEAEENNDTPCGCNLPDNRVHVEAKVRNRKYIKHGKGMSYYRFWTYYKYHLIFNPEPKLEEGKYVEGGIYIASNADKASKIWNSKVQRNRNKKEVIGRNGDVEHLRSYIGEDYEMTESNYVYWITDRTPYETFPCETKSRKGQCFKLVTSEVGEWCEKHSTKNPFGIVPDPAITKIIKDCH